jgi:hypothetical protein
MQCIFYDRVLAKKIPCLLVANKIHVNNGIKYCKVTFDSSKFVEYNVTKYELDRYSSDSVKINEIYPARNQTEIDYANACIPNAISNNHITDELNRFESLITMLTDVSSITSAVFYNIADFISYDLLFFYCTHNERVFLLTISTVELTSLPDPIPVPQIVRSVKRIMDKFPDDETIIYRIQNHRDLSEFSYLTFPLSLNIPILKYNVDYLVYYM